MVKLKMKIMHKNSFYGHTYLNPSRKHSVAVHSKGYIHYFITGLGIMFSVSLIVRFLIFSTFVFPCDFSDQR